MWKAIKRRLFGRHIHQMVVSYTEGNREAPGVHKFWNPKRVRRWKGFLIVEYVDDDKNLKIHRFNIDGIIRVEELWT